MRELLRRGREAIRAAAYRAQGLQYGSLYPPPGCPVCGSEMIRIPDADLPPHARGGPSMWYCPDRADTRKHPLGTQEA